MLVYVVGCVREHIVGGHEAKPHSRPFMVYVSYLGPVHNTWKACDGFLVREDFVMTAAHCKGKSMRVYTGVHNRRKDIHKESELNVVDIHAHPDYSENFSDHRNDIMLLKLGPKATLSDWVQPLELPRTENEAVPETNCLVPGWGLTDFSKDGKRSDVLREVNVTVDSSLNCDTPNTICSHGPKGPFMGDSGGPLVCGNAAYGVVSTFVLETKTYKYAQISRFRHWINQIMNSV
ncbi:hypothetical protein ACEWY4_014280 [Coilia grayii]|uniref:trypsin n=1 Tax=Coilia grayii TaxID=363190 RepID=A0ABD1JRU1_9TELE